MRKLSKLRVARLGSCCIPAAVAMHHHGKIHVQPCSLMRGCAHNLLDTTSGKDEPSGRRQMCMLLIAGYYIRKCNPHTWNTGIGHAACSWAQQSSSFHIERARSYLGRATYALNRCRRQLSVTASLQVCDCTARGSGHSPRRSRELDRRQLSWQ